MRDIDTIVVHCTATRPQWWAGKSAEEKVREVRHWHVFGNNWADIGYHFLIDRDGTVVEGRPVERTGAHARGHNTTSIGMIPKADQISFPPEALTSDMVVMDVVYTPLRTRLLDAAEQKGCTTIDGLSMFIAQAAAQFELWTGITPDTDLMRGNILTTD